MRKPCKFILAGLALLMACGMHAQTTDRSAWLGVWHAKQDGQPSVTLTLAEDHGELGGTVVFYVVTSKDGAAQVAGSSVHMVVHPSLEGNTLTFSVTRRSDAKLLKMAVVRESDDKLKIQCVNCGDDPATAELRKSRP